MREPARPAAEGREIVEKERRQRDAGVASWLVEPIDPKVNQSVCGR